jgi:flagellar basal-body rod modification protein FlgD
MSTTPVQSWYTLPTASSSGATDTTPAAKSAEPAVDKDMFLQLLVAQLKNQDPENPADGLQFVTQLAQFTSLEQSAGMRDDLDAIRAVLTAPPADSTTSDTTTSDTTKS